MRKLLSKKGLLLFLASIVCFGLAAFVFAASSTSGSGIAVVARTAKSNLASVAELMTAVSYVAGMGFAIAAIVKFKAHRDNPAQVGINLAIVMLFVAAALLFIPSVYKSAGRTLFASGAPAGISGVSSFGS